jgi:hypothetical protein
MLINPVAVEKLASEKSAKIKTRQEALQTIFFDDLDIFYPRISTCFGKTRVFQQPPDFSTVKGPAAAFKLIVVGLKSGLDTRRNRHIARC